MDQELSHSCAEGHVDRRSSLKRLWALAALAMVSCGGGSPSPAPVPATSPSPPSPPPPAPPPPTSPAPPALGAHSLVYNRDGVSVAPLVTDAMATQAAGSTLLVCVGRGGLSNQRVPTDSQGNTFQQIGSAHAYTNWPSSGTALYACAAAAGGTGHRITVPKPVASDETTAAAVEIVGGGVIRDVQWREVLRGNPITSPTVTTRGPAVIVAWWWGDADVNFDKTAVPDSGFAVIDSILLQGALVQCAVAVRVVPSAGSYQTTWTATPAQGAQLWIAAIEAA